MYVKYSTRYSGDRHLCVIYMSNRLDCVYKKLTQAEVAVISSHPVFNVITKRRLSLLRVSSNKLCVIRTTRLIYSLA